MLQKIEKFVGGMKMAVILILVFTVCMIIGTFQESLHGTEYAGKLIYKSTFFMFLQFLLFLCITMAALLRMPPKKRLYGFYTIHLGLIIIIMGSFVTFYAGIDGHLTLTVNDANSEVVLPDDIVKIEFPDKGSSVTYPLPDSVTETEINQTYEGITIQTFLPFADEKVEWVESKTYKNLNPDLYHSSEYLINNDFIGQNLFMSLHPEVTQFKSSQQLGPLGVHYLPFLMAKCFQKKNPSGLIFWSHSQNICFTPEEKNISIQKTQTGKKFVVIPLGNKFLTFFPETSPWPMENIETGSPEPNKASAIKLFNKNLFQKNPHLFLFGKSLAFYEDNQWHHKYFSKKEPIDLPWMGFTARLEKNSTQLIPVNLPYPVIPRQEKSQIVSGNTKAVKVKVKNQEYWLKSNQRPTTLLVDGERIRLELTKRSMVLPFNLTLERFKMKTDPGTNNPASYESFVKLFDKQGTDRHHIYMNNPLKYLDFTFYQSSYFKDGSNNYGSVLSVNFDPGRSWKYFGSLLLVFGAIWHYHIRRKLIKKRPT